MNQSKQEVGKIAQKQSLRNYYIGYTALKRNNQNQALETAFKGIAYWQNQANFKET